MIRKIVDFVKVIPYLIVCAFLIREIGISLMYAIGIY